MGRMSEQTPPPPIGGNPYSSSASEPMSPADEKLWSILIHIGGIVFGFVAPLIGYLVLKDRGPFVREHSAAALNFQLTMLIGYVIGTVTVLFVIGIFILIAVWVLTIVFGILAAVAANQGRYYTYPLAIKFVG
jgi:uncharacterized Tic20 family protein